MARAVLGSNSWKKYLLNTWNSCTALLSLFQVLQQKVKEKMCYCDSITIPLFSIYIRKINTLNILSTIWYIRFFLHVLHVSLDIRYTYTSNAELMTVLLSEVTHRQRNFNYFSVFDHSMYGFVALEGVQEIKMIHTVLGQIPVKDLA